MTITLTGILHGRRIDLDTDAPIPDGLPVTVRIEPRQLSTKDKRRIVAATAAAWADDTSLDAIFTAIARSRRDTVPREAGLE
jgi:hypothetical protein